MDKPGALSTLLSTSKVNGRRPPLALLVLVTAIAPAALHMVVPSLPLLATVFDAPAANVQLVLTLFLAGIATGQLVYGPVSDRLGRRPVLIAGLLLFLVGTALCGLAWSLPVLIVGRVIEACGGCAGMVLGRAIVRDLFDRERSASAIATITMAMSLAPSISPAIGAYLAEWVGWRADFALLGAVGARSPPRWRAAPTRRLAYPKSYGVQVGGRYGLRGRMLRKTTEAGTRDATGTLALFKPCKRN